MKFVLPLPPNRANARWHWRQENRLKTRYYSECDRLQLLQTVPGPPKVPLRKARAEITLYQWARQDRDNAWARLKWALDWLVTRGYIVDDRDDVLDIRLSQEVDRKHQRVEITLEAA